MLNGTGKKRKPTENNVKYFLGVVWVTKVTQDTENSCHRCHPINWLPIKGSAENGDRLTCFDIANNLFVYS